jgi:hypothetical protein
MKKGQEKEIKFSPADYDYMDNMELKGWIWEIIRRSSIFENHYRKIANILKDIKKTQSRELTHNSILEKEKGCNIPCGYTLNKFIKGINPHIFVKSTVIEGYVFFYPKPQSKYIDTKQLFDTNGLYIPGVSPVSILTHSRLFQMFSGDVRPEKLGRFFFGYRDAHELEDKIYITLSKRTKIKFIKEKILPHLQKYFLIPAQPRLRDDKWKYYLLVYDLKNKYPYASYDDISDVLSESYPNIKIKRGKEIKGIKGYDFFSAKNCENFYKSALALINGDYKKYLYL